MGRDAALLRDEVEILTATVSDDSQGGHTVTAWESVAVVRAQVLALSGREALQAGMLQSVVTHRVTMRYRTPLTTEHRLKRRPDGPTYEITAVRDVDGRRRWLELDAVEVTV